MKNLLVALSLAALAACSTGGEDQLSAVATSMAPAPPPSIREVRFTQFLECKQIKNDVPVPYPANAPDPNYNAQIMPGTNHFLTDYRSNGDNQNQTFVDYDKANASISLSDDGRVNGFSQVNDGRAIYGSRKLIMNLTPVTSGVYRAVLHYKLASNMESTGGVGSSDFSLGYAAILYRNGVAVGSTEAFINDGREHQVELLASGGGKFQIEIKSTDLDARVQGFGNWRTFTSDLDIRLEVLPGRQ